MPKSAKQDLLFLHGFRGNGLGLQQLADLFPKDKYRVFVPALPPAGGQSLKEYSVRHYARFVANYIKENHLKNPVLVGHSMGSVVTAAVAERYPELIADKIVFLAPISVKPSFFFAMLTPLTTFLPNKLIGYITTKFMFIPKSDRQLFRKTLETTYLCGADFVSKSDVYKSAKFSASFAISDFTITQKALFLSGAHDRLIPRKKTDEVAKSFRAPAKYIENSGHLLNYEAPEATAAAIQKFLD